MRDSGFLNFVKKMKYFYYLFQNEILLYKLIYEIDKNVIVFIELGFWVEFYLLSFFIFWLRDFWILWDISIIYQLGVQI